MTLFDCHDQYGTSPTNATYNSIEECWNANPFPIFSDCGSLWISRCEEGNLEEDYQESELEPGEQAYDDTQEFYDQWGTDDPFYDPPEDDPHIDDSLENGNNNNMILALVALFIIGVG